MSQWTYKIKPAGRGNWKASAITVSARIPLGMIISIGKKRYRIIDIVNVSGG